MTCRLFLLILFLRTKKKRGKVIIGNDVLISLNAIVLEGVQIGDGAVIAAGAVVTKNVQPYEIVGGVPAKHIRYRCSGDIIAQLETIQWWNMDDKTIRDLAEKRINISDIKEME